MPWRIAFCITELDPGGAERALVELATRLDRRQFSPVVYCLGPRPAGNPVSLADRLEQAGITVHCFGARNALSLPGLVRKLRRQIELDRPQLLQSFLFHANTVGARAARGGRVPHVVTGIRVAERGKAWHRVVAQLTDRWVQRHVCVSQAVADFSRDVTGLSAEKLVVIPNGVELDRFAHAQPIPLAELRVPANRRLITTVGRLEAQKGMGWLIEQMPRIFAQAPTHDLLIVGEGREQRELEHLTRQLGIAERVHFAGYREDVPRILAASELFALASRWEGMPNVVLEAMAAGRPVVAREVEGLRELLGPQDQPQIVPFDKPEQFVTAAVKVLTDAALATRLGRENQQRAADCFSLEAMVSAYERLYRTLLEGPAQG